MQVAAVSARELAERCAMGFGFTAGEPPVLVVDLTGRPPARDAPLAPLVSAPCVLVGLGPSDTWDGALARSLDVVTDEAGFVAGIVDAVVRTPIAAVTGMLLLRATEGMAAHAALVAESTTYSALQSGPEFGRWVATAADRSAPTGPDEAEVLTVDDGDGAEVVITLHRPHRHNALDRRLRAELADALRAAVLRPGTRVVLRGAGPSFCSGGDLAEFGTFSDPATAHLVRLSSHPAAALIDLGPDRVRSHVHGACVGSGLELAAFGAVEAHPDAWFQLPEIGLGLVPGAGGTVSIPRRIGRRRTARLMLTAERLDAATALEWGLIDSISAM